MSFVSLSPPSLLLYSFSSLTSLLHCLTPPLSHYFISSLFLSHFSPSLSHSPSLSLSLSRPLSLSPSEIYIQIHFAPLNLDLQEENVVGSKFMLKRSKVGLRWERANPRSHLRDAWPQKTNPFKLNGCDESNQSLFFQPEGLVLETVVKKWNKWMPFLNITPLFAKGYISDGEGSKVKQQWKTCNKFQGSIMQDLPHLTQIVYNRHLNRQIALPWYWRREKWTVLSEIEPTTLCSTSEIWFAL